MKKWIGLVALMTAANSVMAAGLLYEPFDYPAGTSLDNLTAPNGAVWAQAGGTATTTLQTVAGTMASTTPAGSTISPDYASLPASQGNILQFNESANNGWSDRISIGNYLRPDTGTNTTSNEVDLFYSLEVRVDSVTDLTTSLNGAFIAGFSNSAGTQSNTPSVFLGRLWLKRDSAAANSTFSFSVSNQESNNSGNIWLGGYNPGQDYFVVVEYSMLSSDPTADTASIWIDPAASSFGTSTPPAPNLTFTYPGSNAGAGGFTIQSFDLRQTASSPESTSVDEARVDTSWAGVTALEWTSTGNNSWSSAGNWSNQNVPNNVGTDLTFGANSSVQNVTLTSPITAGVLRFNTNNYTIGGTSTLTLDQTTMASSVNTQTPAQIVISSGSDTVSAPVQLNKNTSLTVPGGSSLTLSGGVTAASGIAISVTSPYTTTGTLTPGGNTVITPASKTALTGLTGLSVLSGNLQLAATHATVTTTAFNIGPSSTLDLTNNDLIVDYAPNAGNPTGTDTTTGPAVVAAVVAAYDGGLWDKAGITTSAGPAGSGTTLAVLDNETLATPLAAVDGVTLDSSSVVVKYTWYGDLDLDGAVTDSDLTTITADAGMSNVGWSGGDLNYDGIVNADDVSLFQLGAAESGGANINSVPEPSAALALAGIGMLASRRRRSMDQ